MLEFLSPLFSSDFMPHGFCYLWNPRMVWLHVIADGLIALSYYCIPVILVYFTRKHPDRPFNRVFWMFGAFILACGTTHLLEVWNVWHGSYLLAGVVKAFTAAVSVLTAVTLVAWAPKVISLPGRIHLQGKNVELQSEIVERKRAAAALKESLAATERALQDLADIKFALDQHAIVAVTDLHGTITYVNRRFTAVNQYSSEEAIGQNYRIMNSGYHPKQFFQQMYETIAHGQVWHGEIRNRAKDGSIFWVDATIVPLLDAARQPRQYVTIRTNITQRKRMERSLRLLSDCNQSLAQATDEASLLRQVCDLVVNVGGYRMAWVGYAGHDPKMKVPVVAHSGLETSYLDAAKLTWADQERGRGPAGTAIRTGFPALCRDITSDPLFAPWREQALQQGYRSCLALPLHNDDEVLGAISIYATDTGAFDDTEQRLLEELSTSLSFGIVALRALAERRRGEETRDRLAAVVESSDDAIISKSLDGKVTAWNSGAEKVFGYTAAESLGKSLDRLLPPEHPNEESEILTRVTRGERINHFETTRLRKDGQRIHISATISPVKDRSGAIVGVAKIARDITERKQTDEARERLAAAVECSDDAIISKTMDGMISSWNPGAEKLFGYTAAEVMGKPLLLLLPPDRAAEENDTLECLRQGRSVTNLETVRVRKDGLHIDVSVTISPIRDRAGSIVGASKIARDITERKRVLEALRQSEERFQAIANGIPQLAWMAEADGSVFWFNQRWYDYTGTTLEQSRDWSWRNVHDPNFLPQVLERWQGAIDAGIPFEMEFPLRGGDGHFRVFLTQVMPVKDAEGSVTRWFGTNTDITEWKEAEKRLALQAEELARSRVALESQTLLLQSVLDSISEGLVVADHRENLVIWNPAAAKIIGMGATTLPSSGWPAHYGLFLSDAVTPLAPEQDPLTRALHGEVCTAQLFVRNPKIPAGVWIEASASPLKDKSGAEHGGVCAFRDITERKKIEAQIRHMNDELEIRVLERTVQLEAANQELEAFSYSVSHDLRAPLRHISGFSQMLTEEFGPTLDPGARDYLDRIQAGTLRMGLLLDELLNLARLGRHALHPQPTQLNSVVAEVLAILQPETAGRQVDWIIADLPLVDCDAVLVQQVFQNLLVNALKFTRPRPRAVIEISCEFAPPEAPDGPLVFMVRDNGVGFNMKYADKLFGVFQRLHRTKDFEGTGIGLATVQRIIHKHGGRVWAEAEQDVGAAFYFTLGVGKQTATKGKGVTAGGRS